MGVVLYAMFKLSYPSGMILSATQTLWRPKTSSRVHKLQDKFIDDGYKFGAKFLVTVNMDYT